MTENAATIIVALLALAGTLAGSYFANRKSTALIAYRPEQLETGQKRFEFSKLILCFETVLVAYVSHRVLGFVETAIVTGYTGSLPYLTTFITAVWAAYGASVSFYQQKSGRENVKKIETAVNATPDCTGVDG